MLLRKNLTNFTFKCLKVIPLEEIENFYLTIAVSSGILMTLIYYFSIFGEFWNWTRPIISYFYGIDPTCKWKIRIVHSFNSRTMMSRGQNHIKIRFQVLLKSFLKRRHQTKLKSLWFWLIWLEVKDCSPIRKKIKSTIAKFKDTLDQKWFSKFHLSREKRRFSQKTSVSTSKLTTEQKIYSIPKLVKWGKNGFWRLK